MRHLDDSHMAQIDAAAARRAQAEDWRDSKPTKHLGSGLHPLFADILASHGMPQSPQAERVTEALAEVLTAEPETAALMFREAEPLVPVFTEYSVWITLADGIRRELAPIKAATVNEAHGMAIRAGIAAFKQPLTASVTPRRSTSSAAYGVMA